jgi:hypothetical protein
MRRVLSAIVLMSVAGLAAVACNFIVDAEFSGKVLPGQDGGCSLGNPTDPQCAQCVRADSCKDYLNAVCNDKNGQYLSTLSKCVNDPDVRKRNCDDVFIDAGYANYDDQATHWHNLRVCVTQKCKNACTTCKLTYERYTGDDNPPPLTVDTSPCAKCLLAACWDVLIDTGETPLYSHDVCCNQTAIDYTWGPCARPRDAGGDPPNCSGILKWFDAGSPSSCVYKLSKCAIDFCAEHC